MKHFTFPPTRFRLNAALALAAIACAGLSRPTHAKEVSVNDLVKSFESNKEYVQPFATLFGSITNSGWYQSSSVPRGFSFYVGLPISTTLIADADRSFDGTWVDNGCKEYHKQNPTGTQPCTESKSYSSPTIFGRDKGPVLDSNSYTPISNSISSTPFHVPQNDGNPDLSSMNFIPFLQPQIGLSYYHTEVKLRYILVPLSSYNLNMPAVGIQHDLASFLPPLPYPVNFSVAANWTFLSAAWKPGGDIDGEMTLNGTSAFYGVLTGYTYKNWLELFVEMGWETSSIKTGGDLTIVKKDEPDEKIKPNLTLEGRNGFRAGLNIAFHFGYDAVLGQNVGANLGNSLGVLAYRYKK